MRIKPIVLCFALAYAAALVGLGFVQAQEGKSGKGEGDQPKAEIKPSSVLEATPVSLREIRSWSADTSSPDEGDLFAHMRDFNGAALVAKVEAPELKDLTLRSIEHVQVTAALDDLGNDLMDDSEDSFSARVMLSQDIEAPNRVAMAFKPPARGATKLTLTADVELCYSTEALIKEIDISELNAGDTVFETERIRIMISAVRVMDGFGVMATLEVKKGVNLVGEVTVKGEDDDSVRWPRASLDDDGSYQLMFRKPDDEEKGDDDKSAVKREITVTYYDRLERKPYTIYVDNFRLP